MELNKTYFGDCLEVMQQISDKSIDMILCDLPYGTTNCSWDSIIDLEKLWGHYLRITKETSPILLFAQTPFDKILGSSNIRMLKYEWIWEKTQATGHLNAKKMPMKAHENILVFYKKLPTYNPQKTDGHIRKVASAKNRAACIERINSLESYLYNKEIPEKVHDYNSTERYPRTVLKFKTDKQTNALHPTQKPLALCEYLISTYSNIGDVILDSCAGSGTTGLAAKNLNRKYIMIEKEEKYFQIAKQRLNEL